MRVAVMGSGSWGTVFSQLVSDAGNDVVLWSRKQKVADAINKKHKNPEHVSDIELPRDVVATTDAAAALAGADIVVIALPSQAYRENLLLWRDLIPEHAVVVSLAKGIEIGSNMRMSEVMAQSLGIDSSRVAVVSGPNLAREIGLRQPTATTVACVDENNAQLVQDACAGPYFRPYYTTDVLGVEIAGAMKNVIALANGIAVGMKLGENSQSALITRGLHEMAQLGRALGANPMTFMGLAGVGDLLATSQSPLSRNRSFGFALAQGKTVDQVISETKETCEAVKSCLPLLQLGRDAGVDLPITAGVVGVVHRNLQPEELVRRFMARETKPEASTD
ncbi:MAG: glycerol-3-phosphate dehydrogenase [Actinomycetota bacterium]